MVGFNGPLVELRDFRAFSLLNIFQVWYRDLAVGEVSWIESRSQCVILETFKMVLTAAFM